MKSFFPLREIPAKPSFGRGDVLVLFGELFNRGYANGLVEAAEKAGVKIVRATVGRREKNGQLRALTAEEIQGIPQPFINVPLEAGFDMEPDSQGRTPIEQLKDIKLPDWQTAKLDFSSIEESQKKGTQRFRDNVTQFMKELEPHLPADGNVLFAHLMAGGVPRAKIIMPLMNRAFKGVGDRYLPSKDLWDSDIGKLCSLSFFDVTAETLRHLIQLSQDVREKVQARGHQVSYVAYGYHGTEIWFNGSYQWQTYTPYIQGWAKRRLEDISREYHSQGIKTAVYNCPEILTNSSSIFQGVEVSLYPLLFAVEKESNSAPAAQALLKLCKTRLKADSGFEKIKQLSTAYFQSPLTKEYCQFDKWPQHSSKEQLDQMLACSEALIDCHESPKQLITSDLSETVFRGCGLAMLADAGLAEQPVVWLGHDLMAKSLLL